MGFYRYFSEKNDNFEAHPVFPVNNSDGSHRIEGIGDSFVPEILCLNELEEIIRIPDSNAISVARLLNKKGLSVGISSGANILAALIKKNSMSDDSIVGTILCDDNKKYLSTDLFSDTNEDIGYDLKILDYKVLI
jgi:cysteine synthase A